MTNTDLLKYYMAKSKLTIQKTADLLGLSYWGFYKKLSNKSYFNSREISVLCGKLGIKKDKEAVFFADSVD